MHEKKLESNKVGGRQKITMLEYCMILLGKISFDEKLFRKEYLKALRYLKPVEQEKLKSWVLQNRQRAS